MLIGGGGKRVLGIAAARPTSSASTPAMHAGVVGPDAIASMTAESVDEKVAIVRAAAGDRLADIEMNVRVFMVNVTDDRAGARRLPGQRAVVDETMIERRRSRSSARPPKLIEDLLERRERWGFSYIIVGGEDVESFAPVVAALAGK
jgi:hypothetical protein